MKYIIVAIEQNHVFDKNHAHHMQLPFDRGWDKWAVHEVVGKDLLHIADFDTHAEAEAFIERAPAAFASMEGWYQ